MSESEIKGNEERSERSSSKSRHHHHSDGSHSHHSSHHHSDGSHSHHHSHHHSGSSHSHHSEGSKRYRDSNKKKETNENFSAEYSKHKKIRLWWRSAFIAVIIVAMMGLVVLIANSGKYQDGLFIKKYSPNSDVGKLQEELAELEVENDRLKYELDKYIEAYGELGAEEEEETELQGGNGTVKK